jgi:hypothetical protein
MTKTSTNDVFSFTSMARFTIVISVLWWGEMVPNGEINLN